MKNQNGEEKGNDFLETVIRDVVDVVKFSKSAEIAFEEYYKNPSVANIINVLNGVTSTDFYKLGNRAQHYVAFVIGLICEELLDNNIKSERRKKFNAFPSLSFIGSLTENYIDSEKKDENFRRRIVNIANCKNADEIISYIRTELAHYIDRSFNAYRLVINLLEADKSEENMEKILKKWIIYDFINIISGKNSDNDSTEED